MWEAQPRNNSAALGQSPGSASRDAQDNRIKTQKMEDVSILHTREDHPKSD